MPKLILLSQNADEYVKRIEAVNLPGLEIVNEPEEAEIVFGEPVRIRETLPRLQNVKWIQSMWAGVEPLLEASRRDYILTNARGVFGGLMSEYIFAYLLAHERKLLQRAEAQKMRKWDNTLTGTLRGRTIGLLGVGSIGAEVARTAKFFHMTVRGYTRSSEACPYVDEYFHPDGQKQALSQRQVQKQASAFQRLARDLDYLVSILPNTNETQKIINAGLLEALPSRALFINVGRGSAVDESALIEALKQNKIAGAILDVFEREPLPKEHPFWDAPNLTMTFHTSAPSLPEDISKLFIENYMQYIEGKPLKYQVDFEKGY